jgi:hypothetical protein
MAGRGREPQCSSDGARRLLRIEDARDLGMTLCMTGPIREGSSWLRLLKNSVERIVAA